MTRKDYDLITEVFTVAMQQYIHNEIVGYVANDMANKLKEDNPSFDLDKFMQNVRGE